MSRSDGASADYYVLPEGATQLQDLISHRNMNAQIGEIFRAGYRYGMASHSDMLRDAKKIRFYAQAEVDRLENLTSIVKGRTLEECANPLNEELWLSAPEWANWCGQNLTGEWEFYEDRPPAGDEYWEHEGRGQPAYINGPENPDWRNTLHPRPTSTAQ